MDRREFVHVARLVAQLPDNERRANGVAALISHNDVQEDKIDELKGSQKFAETSWCADDLTENFEMTTAQARKWLKENEQELLDRMVSAGNDYISNNCPAGMRL